MSNELPARPLERTVRPVRHGTDCKKVEHLGDGYLHRADDNGPYDVDGLVYCGRCHEWLGTISSGTDDSCTHPNCSCWMKVCGHGAKAKRPNTEAKGPRSGPV